MQLWELDAAIRGGNDHTDTNAYDRRKDNGLVYQPDTVLAGGFAGGSRLKGRLGDGERASLRYRITTVTPVPSQITPKPPPPAQGSQPDLVISDFNLQSFTVKNVGTAAAGPFTVSRTGSGGYNFPALAPGASITQSAPVSCFAPIQHIAVADSTSQVAESDETNNTATFTPIC